MVREACLVGYQTIDQTCSSRRQGINGRHTTGTRYVQPVVRRILLKLIVGNSYDARDDK